MYIPTAWDSAVTTNSEHASAFNHSAMEPTPFWCLQNEWFPSSEYRVFSVFLKCLLSAFTKETEYGKTREKKKKQKNYPSLVLIIQAASSNLSIWN